MRLFPLELSATVLSTMLKETKGSAFIGLLSVVSTTCIAKSKLNRDHLKLVVFIK